MERRVRLGTRGVLGSQFGTRRGINSLWTLASVTHVPLSFSSNPPLRDRYIRGRLSASREPRFRFLRLISSERRESSFPFAPLFNAGPEKPDVVRSFENFLTAFSFHPYRIVESDARKKGDRNEGKGFLQALIRGESIRVSGLLFLLP